MGFRGKVLRNLVKAQESLFLREPDQSDTDESSGSDDGSESGTRTSLGDGFQTENMPIGTNGGQIGV